MRSDRQFRVYSNLDHSITMKIKNAQFLRLSLSHLLLLFPITSACAARARRMAGLFQHSALRLADDLVVDFE